MGFFFVWTAISMACTLVEVLKRQKIAEIESVRTSVDVDPTFYGGKLSWGRAVTAIRFVLKRGEHAEYVSDYHQRKVIEIFENRDKEKNGKLAKTIVEGLNMGEVFYAGEERINQASEFLKNINGDSLNLPDFIRYASILIHPLLKDRIFKVRNLFFFIFIRFNFLCFCSIFMFCCFLGTIK